ncbi:MAG: hypothetical protein N3A38_05920 [Planctomycetota bacterium]|nr:hypothetical protein [Planctomycetota bacterium]
MGIAILEIVEKIRPFVFKAVYRDGEQVWAKEDDFLSVQDTAGRHYLLMLPPHTGYRWVEQDPSGRTRYYEIEGREDVATAAGRFAGCVRVLEEDRLKTWRTIHWYAPGVGLVRRSKYSRMGEEIFRAELVSFRVRPSEDGPLPPWQWRINTGKKAPGGGLRRSGTAGSMDAGGAWGGRGFGGGLEAPNPGVEAERMGD